IMLCRTNYRLNLICQTNSTWIHLLRRDFKVSYTGENAHNLYLLYRHTLGYFSEFYPIITQRALNILVNIAPPSTWNSLEEAIKEHREAFVIMPIPLILSVSELTAICSEIRVDKFG